MGYARVPIAPDLLLERLLWPADTRIVGADMNHSHGDVVLTVQHPDLRDVAFVTGEGWPSAHPMHRRVGDQPIETFISWGQDARVADR